MTPATATRSRSRAPRILRNPAPLSVKWGWGGMRRATFRPGSYFVRADNLPQPADPALVRYFARSRPETDAPRRIADGWQNVYGFLFTAAEIQAATEAEQASNRATSRAALAEELNRIA